MEGIASQEVRDHLERIVASEMFSNAARLCRFLRFTVESKLGGRGEQVKEFVIGREVYDRTDGYDPRLDPIVRVEARRLRAKLAEYYAGPGSTESVRLEYPRGTYLPVVLRRPPPSTATAARRSPFRRRSAIVAGLAIVGFGAVALATYHFFAPRTWGTVAVVPVRWISDADGLDAADAGVAEAIDADIANRRIAPVIAWPEMLRFQKRHAAVDAIATAERASTILMISVRRVDRQNVVSAFVMDAGSRQKRRVASYTRDDVSTFASQRSIASEIVDDLTPVLRGQR